MTQQMFTVMFYKIGLEEDCPTDQEGEAIVVSASEQHALDHIRDNMKDYKIVSTSKDEHSTYVKCIFEQSDPATYFVITHADYVG